MDKEKTEKNENGEFERYVLRQLGLPEDYVPEDENEAYRLMVAFLED
jgi:hypothetical protein